MVLLVPMMMIMTGGQVAKAKLPDGKLAAKLDEYHISVKCMANIVEHYVPGKFVRSVPTAAAV